MPEPAFELTSSRQFPQWLAEQQLSLACTTYQAGFSHDGTEGELYHLVEDPLQRVNRWDDPSVRALRSDLLADLWDHQPPQQMPLRGVDAAV